MPRRASGPSVAISDASRDYGAAIVPGANLEVDPADLDRDDLWAEVGMLALQNEVKQRMSLAPAQAAPVRGVCLNAAPHRPLSSDLSALIDVLVANVLEAEAFSGVAVTDLRSAGEAIHALSRTFSVEVVIAGGDDVAVAVHGTESFSFPAERITLVSTHGAGDVFTGTLAAALVNGILQAEAARTANGPPPGMCLA